MALVACARCGEETPEENLLYHQAGRICAACELDIDEADQTSRGVFATVVGGPIIVFIGSVMFCFGSMGGIPMFVAGAYGGWTGITSLLEAYRVVKSDDQAVGGLGRGMLLLSGLFTFLWSLPLMAVGLFEIVRLTGLIWEPRGLMQLTLPI
ncbi:MAG: hypothetical protein EP330_02435 [Deltaproteobacteria bacterium]|nr:MAG: hypothetical protein EP330_02435 [Deltaproteobacteria bacterium]